MPQKINRLSLLTEVRVRVKRRGKSSPHFRQREWQGKPHPVQDQIGQSQEWFRSISVSRQKGLPGRSLEVHRKVNPRGMAIPVLRILRNAETKPGLQARFLLQS